MAKSKAASKSTKKTTAMKAGASQSSSKKSAKSAAKPAAVKGKAKMSSPKPVKMMVKKSQESAGDIIQLILADHKELKKLIQILKDSENALQERQVAFVQFAPLLTTHSKPEERTMYRFLKDDDELREEGYEGEVEHGLADQLAEEIKRTDDEDIWSARVKVLAELVEHHIEEEEDQLLPDFRKHSEKEERVELGREFLRLKQELEEMGGQDTVEEADEDYMIEDVVELEEEEAR